MLQKDWRQRSRGYSKLLSVLGLPLPWCTLPVFILQPFCLAQKLQRKAQSLNENSLTFVSCACLFLMYHSYRRLKHRSGKLEQIQLSIRIGCKLICIWLFCVFSSMFRFRDGCMYLCRMGLIYGCWFSCKKSEGSDPGKRNYV